MHALVSQIMDGSPSRGMYLRAPYPSTNVNYWRSIHILLNRIYVSNLVWHTGETIPIRLFLGGFDLTPTFREVNKKYSTRYYLSLVLIDEGMFILF